MGASGARGPQGSVGEVGAQGRVGELDCWTSYRDFWFQSNSAEIQSSEHSKLAEVASYMKANPSLEIGIDSSVDVRRASSRDRSLNDRRVAAVRSALIEAGESAANIKVGSFGDPELRREGRVEVLIATGK
jgi:outer membrane protein OmpA-like peptidoglycan-associated protein